MQNDKEIISLKSNAFVGIGSNMGDSIGNCEKAISMLTNIKGIDYIRVSSFYLTPPQGILDQNWFVNCAAFLDTNLEPESLLALFMSIEDSMGRIRAEKWGARIIDLDLLIYDEQILHNNNLTLPHPRMHERGFVMVPMVEIAPDIVHPVLKRTMRDILPEVDNQGIRKIGKTK